MAVVMVALAVLVEVMIMNTIVTMMVLYDIQGTAGSRCLSFIPFLRRSKRDFSHPIFPCTSQSNLVYWKL